MAYSHIHFREDDLKLMEAQKDLVNLDQAVSVEDIMYEEDENDVETEYNTAYRLA